MDNVPEQDLQSLQIGTIVQGRVKYISKFYSIIQVDTIECILPTSEMAWAEKPRCNVKLNDELEAVVVRIEDGQVMVSTKRLQGNPWNNVLSRYSAGQQLKVKVINISAIGAFVELEPGLRGLIHRKQLSYGRVIDPNDFVSIGQIIDAEIIEILPDKQRLSLTRHPFLNNPWDNVEHKYPVGRIVICKIKEIRDYGLIVELEPNLEALYHRSKINIRKGQKITDLFNVGDDINLEICSIDIENHKLSMKTPSIEE